MPPPDEASGGPSPAPGAPPAPFATGLLPMDDGARIYWETSGNPRGVPLLYLHGGPGGTLGRGGYRRRFALGDHLVVGIDQRGCGRSVPHASDHPETLAAHTTARLIADIEAVREHLGIEAWIVHGVSWGSTLALAYALDHPDRVLGVALMAVTTTSRREVDWITEGVGRIFPEEWARFAAGVGIHRAPGEGPIDEGDRVVARYARRFSDTGRSAESAADRRRAADAWDRWETTHVRLDPRWAPGPLRVDEEDRLNFCTLTTHYWAADGFMRGTRAPRAAAPEPPPILDRVAAVGLVGIPGVLAHGRRDISGPVDTPWMLARAWPEADLRVIEDEGHGGPLASEALAGAVAQWVAGWRASRR
ncbi:alpha/beta fold hydrolase [Schaalia naturae]|uniref:Proline iminopeptidase n=1 Tax=Schaalia naturae TaxID=635203 RepID=A0ABW2SPH5_9ACTO